MLNARAEKLEKMNPVLRAPEPGSSAAAILRTLAANLNRVNLPGTICRVSELCLVIIVVKKLVRLAIWL